MAMAEQRKLRGHTATATCCIASRDCPGLVVTSGEDGCICWFDLRCKDVQFIMDVGTEPVSSLCFKTGNENILYVSSGSEVKCFDAHMLDAGSWKPLESYSYNKEEINQVVCNPRSSFLASADDTGDVKIIDISQKCLYKTLRAGHSSVYAVPFNSSPGDLGKYHVDRYVHPKPRPSFSNTFGFTVVTGGLDSKLVKWDFSKGRPQKVLDFGLLDMNADNSAGQCLNPAFVHAITVPDSDMLDKVGKTCVVARGDGAVNLINVESELSDIKSKTSMRSRKGSSRALHDPEASNGGRRKRVHLDYSVGGHTAAVSCVAFSLFQEKGRYLISGGNDKAVKVWDCFRCLDSELAGNNGNPLHLNINLNKKVNWLCTTPSDSENLVVCDTTKLVKVYSVS